MTGEPASTKSFRKIIFVLDSSAIFAGIPQFLPIKCFTVSRVLDEVRDSRSKLMLERLMGISRIIIIDPEENWIAEALKSARKAGLQNKLSATDISVLALALKLRKEYRGSQVIVVTDDYALQDILLRLDIYVMPVKTYGVKRLQKYETVCPNCGYRGSYYERTCPVCGTNLILVMKRSFLDKDR